VHGVAGKLGNDGCARTLLDRAEHRRRKDHLDPKRIDLGDLQDRLLVDALAG
jgi:hypothetical protein